MALLWRESKRSGNCLLRRDAFWDIIITMHPAEREDKAELYYMSMPVLSNADMI